jgi:HKD family nuclease
METELIQMRWLETEDELRAVITQAIQDATLFSVATSYLTPEGALWLKQVASPINCPCHLIAGATIQVISQLPGILAALGGAIELRLSWAESGLFHPKVFLWRNREGFHMVVGSMNLTGAGLYCNTEGSLYVSTGLHNGEAQRMQDWFEAQWMQCPSVDESVAVSLAAAVHSQLAASQAAEAAGRALLRELCERLRPSWPATTRMLQRLKPIGTRGEINAEYLDAFLTTYSAQELISEWKARWRVWYQWFQDRRGQVGELLSNRRELVEKRLYVSVTTPAHRTKLLRLNDKGHLAIAIQTMYRYRDPCRVDELLSRLQDKAPGVGMATTTELLHFCWPDQYAVYNKRSGVGLGLLFDRPGLFFVGTTTVQDYSFFLSYASVALAQLANAIRTHWAQTSEQGELDDWLGTRPWLVLDHFLEWIWDNSE